VGSQSALTYGWIQIISPATVARFLDVVKPVTYFAIVSCLVVATDPVQAVTLVSQSYIDTGCLTAARRDRIVIELVRERGQRVSECRRASLHYIIQR
jgi:hypothetical protein